MQSNLTKINGAGQLIFRAGLMEEYNITNGQYWDVGYVKSEVVNELYFLRSESNQLYVKMYGGNSVMFEDKFKFLVLDELKIKYPQKVIIEPYTHTDLRKGFKIILNCMEYNPTMIRKTGRGSATYLLDNLGGVKIEFSHFKDKKLYYKIQVSRREYLFPIFEEQIGINKKLLDTDFAKRWEDQIIYAIENNLFELQNITKNGRKHSVAIHRQEQQNIL